MTKKSGLQLFCENIGALQRAFSYSNAEMSRILGISEGELAEIQAFRIPDSVRVDVIFHACDHFGLKPAQLFSECPHKPSGGQ